MELHDAFLVRMAAIVDADYDAGDFAAAFERFRAEPTHEGRSWLLEGRRGSFRVWMQRDVSHLACMLKARAPHVFEGKALMLAQPGTRQDYGDLYLLLTDPFLSEMAAVLGAEYQPGEFHRVFDDMHDEEREEKIEQLSWVLKGPYGWFKAEIEFGEGTCACRVVAQEPQLSAARQLMKDAYLARGGDPARLKP